MTDLSCVSLECKICVVCAASFESGAILLESRLREILEHHTTTGWGLCREHRRLFLEGYVALVEFDPANSGAGENNESFDLASLHRTGRIEHMKRTELSEVLKAQIDERMPCIFVKPGMIESLQARAKPTGRGEPPDSGTSSSGGSADSG